MGQFFSQISACCGCGPDELRILMLGLDNAGKTTTLYKLKFNQPVTTVPTVGFNVECYLVDDNVKLNIWDIGGQDKIRPLWRHYYVGSKALIFVVDSHDRARLHEARQELWRVLRDNQMLRCPLLVFANKQDLQGALSESELVEALGLEQLGSAELTEAGLGNGIGFGVDSSFNRPWKIQQACAVEGKGLWEGIRWLIKAAQEQKAKTRRRTKKERTETAATAATVPSNRP